MSLLFALALLATDPQAAPPASAPPVADSAPMATQGQEDPDYLPKGAPADDFAFVAWCDGVLSGHMDLAAHLADVLPLDDVQQTIGHAYLRAYAKAMAIAPESKTAEGKARAEAARLDGWSRWEAARDTPDKNLAVNTYLAYQLPGRCEHAAERLSHNPHLFALAPSPDEVGAMGTNTIASQADAAAHAPPPMTAPAVVTPPPPATPQAAPSEAMSPPPPAVNQTGQISVQMTEESQPAPAPVTAQAAPPPPPAAEPAAAPAQVVKTAAVVDKKPKRGHLLPPFLRSKASKEKEAAEDTAAAQAGTTQ